MKLINSFYKLFLILSVVLFVSSCEEQLTEMNMNPNGVEPEMVEPNLVLTTVISKTASPYLAMGYNDDVAGIMQYVQKSGWGNGLNKYDWTGERDWDDSYENLRNAKLIYDQAEKNGWEFHMGVAQVIRAFNYGYIADSWGDAPYSAALMAQSGSTEAELFPVFDTQEEIYMGIIEELKTASELLSKDQSEYIGIKGQYDILYGGDVEKWKKFANSLLLRYYMRLSEKDASLAEEGVVAAASAAFTSNSDNAGISFPSTRESDAWPASVTFDSKETNFNRIQLCAGFRDVLLGNNDPRLATWFNEVKIPIKVSSMYPDFKDTIVSGTRYIHPDLLVENDWVIYNKDTWVADIEADKLVIDTMEYCGIPIASSTGDGSGWNLNPAPVQGGSNQHNSALADMFRADQNDADYVTYSKFLEGQMITYAEVCFIMAEAAQKGWGVSGTAQEWYEAGIEASFDYWGVDGSDSFIAEAGVTFDGTLEQIITQKWIANFTIAHESWCDWRRTGFPNLTIGPKGKRDAMPIRFRYGGNEKDRNNANYNMILDGLQETDQTAQDGADSSWSKFWLLQ